MLTIWVSNWLLLGGVNLVLIRIVIEPSCRINFLQVTDRFVILSVSRITFFISLGIILLADEMEVLDEMCDLFTDFVDDGGLFAIEHRNFLNGSFKI